MAKVAKTNPKKRLPVSPKKIVAGEKLNGAYWIPLPQILEARGFQVLLVKARHVKNVPGRKSDVSDCQWLQYRNQCVSFAEVCQCSLGGEPEVLRTKLPLAQFRPANSNCTSTAC